jgi:hypothetical protein
MTLTTEQKAERCKRIAAHLEAVEAYALDKYRKSLLIGGERANGAKDAYYAIWTLPRP